MMNKYKPNILNIAEICAKKNVRHFVLSPGSRCAPLTIALLRHPDIKCYTVTDERSAAFIAMGIAQQIGQTVGLVCTSGTAVLNYAPAITEAYYQKIPLLVLTADRPAEWIDQFDNQSIRQRGIYKEHCLGSFELPVDTTNTDAKWHSDRIVSEAINLSMFPVHGPVHINVPLREPLYPEKEDIFEYDKNVKVINIVKTKSQLTDDTFADLLKTINSSKKILVIAGMYKGNKKIEQSIKKLVENNSVIFISDITANFHEAQTIGHSDIILSTKSEEIHDLLKPDLLITFGGPIVSKSTKNFLKKYPVKEHWHIQESGLIGDTFKSLTKIIPVDPDYFFTAIADKQINSNSEYSVNWKNMEVKASKLLNEFLDNSEFNEFSVIKKILNKLPVNSLLQLGNSMSIRYANYISLSSSNLGIKVNSNRGTSGIDGSLSTTVGASLTTEKITTAIIGDLAFFYDRNALWNNNYSNNLRIIVLNNHGGGIFRILDGSGQLPELDKYFETENKINAENTAKDFNLEYALCKNYQELESSLNTFFQPGPKSKILEIETSSEFNTEIFNKFKKLIAQ